MRGRSIGPAPRLRLRTLAKDEKSLVKDRIDEALPGAGLEGMN